MNASMDAAAEAELTGILERVGVSLADLRLGTDGTVAWDPPKRDTEPLRANELPELLRSDAAGSLELGDVIGEGGMGIVHAAHQPGLRREVAVKLLPTGSKDEMLQDLLIREAQVTGAVAHPNIVPVHALGRDEHGRPVMVMKRVEGSSWQDVLEEEGLEPGDPRHMDDARLSRHLRVLMSVAHAADYAHSLGVLHRDIKPDNVLLGSFGETYLVDWGIAVSAPGCSGVPGAPAAEDVETVCGTPAYMPPEMATGQGTDQGPHTDVYLLGATLHQLLMGRPPHTGGEDVRATLLMAYRSVPPELPEFVPAELAEICRRALAREADDRFASARELHDTLEQFVARQGAIALRSEAETRLDALDELLQRVGRGDAIDAARIQRTFSECRFAFGQARRALPDDMRAEVGLRRALIAMAEHELRSGNVSAAEALLAELPEPHPELAEQCRQGRLEANERDARLASLERHTDVTVGDKLRARLGIGLSVIWLTAHLLLGWMHREQGLSSGHYAATMVLFPVLAVVILFVWRDTLLVHRFNRIISATVVLELMCFLALFAAAPSLGIPLVSTFAVMGFVSCLMLGLLALTLDPTFGIGAGILGPGMLLLFVAPEYVFEIAGVVPALAHSAVAVAWFRRYRGEGSCEWSFDAANVASAELRAGG